MPFYRRSVFINPAKVIEFRRTKMIEWNYKWHMTNFIVISVQSIIDIYQMFIIPHNDILL